MADLKAGKRTRDEPERGGERSTATREGSATLPADKAEPTPRVSAYLRADGSLDVSRMRDETKTQLRKALPQLARELGVSDSGSGSSGSSTAATGLLSVGVVKILESVNMLLLDRMGIPKDVIKEVAPFTPDESQSVLDPLTRVLDKHLGTLLAKWGDETALALALVSVPALKVVQAQAIVAEREKTAATRVPIRAVESVQ